MARAVAPGGKVYAQNDNASEKLAARMKTPAMANAVKVVLPFDSLSDPELRDLDLVTFLFGYHDTTFMAVDRAKMDKALFNALGATTSIDQTIAWSAGGAATWGGHPTCESEPSLGWTGIGRGHPEAAMNGWDQDREEQNDRG